MKDEQRNNTNETNMGNKNKTSFQIVRANKTGGQPQAHFLNMSKQKINTGEQTTNTSTNIQTQNARNNENKHEKEQTRKRNNNNGGTTQTQTYKHNTHQTTKTNTNTKTKTEQTHITNKRQGETHHKLII